MTNLQLSALSIGTVYASITVGGNDAGFAGVLTECAKPAWASNCNAAIDQAQNIINNQFPGRLTTLYSTIRTRAPQAKVVAAGYPRIFNGEDCNAFTWFSPTEESRLNATADLLNAKIQAAAIGSGFVFSNPTAAFIGHAVCDDTEWLNGLSNPIGILSPQQTWAFLWIHPACRDRPDRDTSARDRADHTDRRAFPSRMARQQRRYAAQDRTIRPKQFKAPDLNSPEIKKAAARAGVNLNSRASIDRVDAVYAARQARSHR